MIKNIGTATNKKGQIKPRNIPNFPDNSEVSLTDFLLKYLERNITIINFVSSEGWKLNQATLSQRCAPERTIPEIKTRSKNIIAARYSKYVQSQSQR